MYWGWGASGRKEVCARATGAVKRSTGASKRARQIEDEDFRGLPWVSKFKEA
jgi:hypothetical protein